MHTNTTRRPRTWTPTRSGVSGSTPGGADRGKAWGPGRRQTGNARRPCHTPSRNTGAVRLRRCPPCRRFDRGHKPRPGQSAGQAVGEVVSEKTSEGRAAGRLPRPVWSRPSPSRERHLPSKQIRVGSNPTGRSCVTPRSHNGGASASGGCGRARVRIPSSAPCGIGERHPRRRHEPETGGSSPPPAFGPAADLVRQERHDIEARLTRQGWLDNTSPVFGKRNPSRPRQAASTVVHLLCCVRPC